MHEELLETLNAKDLSVYFHLLVTVQLNDSVKRDNFSVTMDSKECQKLLNKENRRKTY